MPESDLWHDSHGGCTKALRNGGLRTANQGLAARSLMEKYRCINNMYNKIANFPYSSYKDLVEKRSSIVLILF